MGVLSKGITLSYQSATESGATSANELTNLMEIPDLGGEVEAVEITTLADGAHVYMDGLKNYGDSLDFKFLFESTQFYILNGLSGERVNNTWTVSLPSGEKCVFGGPCSVRLDSKGVNAALTYTLSIRPNTEMVWN